MPTQSRVHVRCQECDLRASASAIGRERRVRCPRCEKPITVPAVKPAPLAVPASPSSPVTPAQGNVPLQVNLPQIMGGVEIKTEVPKESVGPVLSTIVGGLLVAGGVALAAVFFPGAGKSLARGTGFPRMS